MNLFVEVQYIFKVLLHTLLARTTLYMNVNIIKLNHINISFYSFGRPMKRKETNVG